MSNKQENFCGEINPCTICVPDCLFRPENQKGNNRTMNKLSPRVIQHSLLLEPIEKQLKLLKDLAVQEEEKVRNPDLTSQQLDEIQTRITSYHRAMRRLIEFKAIITHMK